MAKKTVPALAIGATSPKGFRRAGRFWGAGTQVVAVDELTREQQAALREEAGKGLVVADTTMEIEVPDEPTPAAPDADAASAAQDPAPAKPAKAK
jgi:hypothetical protein